MVKWARIIYLVLAWLFPVAILVQVFLIGLNLFTGASTQAHIGFGHTIGILPLLLVVLAYLGQRPRSEKGLAWLLFGVTIVQTEVFAIIRSSARTLAALHPVVALILFALAVMVAVRARAFVQPPLGKAIPSPRAAGTTGD